MRRKLFLILLCVLITAIVLCLWCCRSPYRMTVINKPEEGFYFEEMYDKKTGVCLMYKYHTNNFREGKFVQHLTLDDGYCITTGYYQHDCRVGDWFTRYPDGNIQSILRYPTSDTPLEDVERIQGRQDPVTAHYYTRQGELCGFTTNGVGIEARFDSRGKGEVEAFSLPQGGARPFTVNWLSEGSERWWNCKHPKEMEKRSQFLSLEPGVPILSAITGYKVHIRWESGTSSELLYPRRPEYADPAGESEISKEQGRLFMQGEPYYVPVVSNGFLVYKYAYSYTNGVTYGRHITEKDLLLEENQPVDLAEYMQIPELRGVSVYPGMDK